VKRKGPSLLLAVWTEIRFPVDFKEATAFWAERKRGRIDPLPAIMTDNSFSRFIQKAVAEPAGGRKKEKLN